MVSNKVLKYYLTKVLLFLTRIFNSCLRIGYFPDSWKRVTIIPISKSSKYHRNLSNYRPIASLSKILERIILRELSNSIGDKIRQEQFAFHRDHSTILKLVKLINELCDNANNKRYTISIFLNVEKAYNRI